MILGTDVSAAGSSYIWTPSCPAGTSFLHVVAIGLSWNGTACATPNTGTSSLVSGGPASDLRYWDFTTGTYDQADLSSIRFDSCSPTLSPNWVPNAPSGVYNYNYFYYLRVDFMDTNGSFLADTIWSVNTV